MSDKIENAEGNAEHIPENVVYVGKKSAMNYVLAVVTQFNNGARSVTIKARGNTISRAVDIAEITRNRFIADAKVGSISIGTEELSNEDGTKSKVSSIQIILTR
ncbi:MAG: DNA-binding protein Alba [Candidatus Micrarchaeaceae archaeon]